MSQLTVVARRGLLSGFLRNNAIRLYCTPANQQSSSTDINKGTHRVNDFEKKMLVWGGKFKSTDEVPNYVSQDVVERARNKFRIKTANIMMALTLFGCILMIISGRKAAERGESVLKMNQEWHKEYNEKAQAEAQAKMSEKK